MKIAEKLSRRIQASNSLLCVGLDPDLPVNAAPDALSAFNRRIIDATHPYAAAYKPNTAFYEAHGASGWQQLKSTIDYIKKNYPDIFIIADAKRGDTENTSRHYARAIFDELGADAVTLHPYLGQVALMPFLEREDKMSIILCRTSNPGAEEFQDVVSDGVPLWDIHRIPMWERVARRVAGEWNTRGNCMLVAGATYPAELKRIREVIGDMPILSPGVGAQGADTKEAVRAGVNRYGSGLLISVSRGIYTDDPASSARLLRDTFNLYRSKS